MGVGLRQSYARVGKFALIKHQRYAHAKQFKRANRALEEAADLSRPRHPRHRPQDRRRQRARSDVRQAAVAGAPRARAAAASARAEGLFACMRRRSSASARARRTGPTSSASRSASPPRSSTAKGGQFVTHVKALPGNPYDGHTLATVIPDMEALDRQHHRAHPRRQRLSRPQCAARLQVQGLHLRPEATGDAADQARIAPQVRRRAGHRPSQGRAPHGPQLSLVTASGDAINAVLAAAGYNFRRLIRWLRLLLRQILSALFAALGDQSSLRSAFFTDDFLCTQTSSVSAGL